MFQKRKQNKQKSRRKHNMSPYYSCGVIWVSGWCGTLICLKTPTIIPCFKICFLAPKVWSQKAWQYPPPSLCLAFTPAPHQLITLKYISTGSANHLPDCLVTHHGSDWLAKALAISYLRVGFTLLFHETPSFQCLRKILATVVSFCFIPSLIKSH